MGGSQVTLKAQMQASEILLLPNILSLSRILLTPAVGYFLWRNDWQSTIMCLGLLAIAGITDALDGYFARKYHTVSDLGLILDPLADKIFAVVLVIELVLFRSFPVWLAAAIIGRDLLILLAGLAVLGRRRVSIPSNLTGQYAFFSIVMLIGVYVIRFETGERILAVCTLVLLLLSTIQYGRGFWAVLHDKTVPRFHDRPLYKAARIGAAVAVLAACLIIYLLERFRIG